MSLIVAISTTDERLPLFAILKGKRWKDDWFTQELELGDHISLGENGWTDNKLYMEWIEECFEPFTRSQLQGEYRLLIVNGHASYVSTKFITFIRAHKIICLCLPTHLAYLLQPLNVSVFGPLKQNYKKLLSEKTRFSTYNIDKTDFISLIQKARRQDISSRNIQSAWRATGLIPYNLAAVFQKISVHSKNNSAPDIDNTEASSNTPIQTRFFSRAIPPTPEQD